MRYSCDEVERVLPEFLGGAPEGVLPGDIEAHVESCPDCSSLVSDLQLIASEARQLAETDEPAPRLWVRIAAGLRAEGLIREPEAAPLRPVPVSKASRPGWQAWWLAPIAAAILAAGAYVVNHKPVAPVVAEQAEHQAPKLAAPAPAAAPPVTAQAPVAAQTAAPAPREVAQAPVQDRNVEPLASEEDRQFLSEVSTREPSMRATYESQLQALNANIREVQAYLDQNPGDEDARQQLMDAYQQKALLYQIALDRIQ